MAVVVGTAQGKLTLDASKFLSGIESAYKELKKFNDLIEDTEKSLKRLPDSVNLSVTGGSGGLTTLPGSTPSYDSSGIDGIGDSASGATKKVELLQTALSKGLTGSLQAVASLAEITFKGFQKYTEFVVDFSKQSLEVGLQFDATMSQVSAISGATGDDFDLLREKAIEMGAQTKFSASEAGQAMVYMGMAGWDTQQIYDGLAGVMSLAASSGEDLATTSDIVTDALTAFGLQAGDASHFADVLAAASVNSNTNVALMGDTFKYVAPLAGTMKYSIEDTAVAIGLMANSGIKGSQAGTALRNVISNLAAPTDKVQGAMDAFGISLSDAEGNSYGLMEMMQQLRTVFQSVTPLTEEQAEAEKEQAKAMFEAGEIDEKTFKNTMARIDYTTGSLEEVQAKIANTISGKYGLSGLLAIVNASSEDFDSLTEAIYGASDGMGAAAQMEEKMMDNLQGSMTIFKSTFKTFQITISDILKGTANEVVKFGQKSIAEMTGALQSEGIPGLIKAIGTILPKGVAEIVKYLPEILPPLVEGFWALVNGLIDALPEAFPIIVDAAFELFLGLADGLVNSTDRLLEILPEMLDYLVEKLLDNAPKILDAAIEMWLNLIQAIIIALPDIIKAAIRLIKDIAKAFNENKDEILETAVELFMALVEGFTDPETLYELMLAMEEIGQLIIDTLCEVNWLEVADTIFSALGDGLLGIFQAALMAIDDLLGTNFTAWGKDVATFFGNLKQQSFDFGKSIANSMQKTEIELNKLKEVYGTTYQNMLDMYVDLIKQGVDAQSAMAQAYQEYFQSAEAQYVFRERYAKTLSSGALSEDLGTGGMTSQQLVDLLSRQQATTGNTYNFYSNEPIDERKAADNLKKVNEEILLGY